MSHKLFNLGPSVYPYIRHVIGDGEDMSFWFDSWHPIGPPHQKFSRKLLYALGLSEGSKVAQFFKGRDWQWPQGREFNLKVRRLNLATPICFASLPDSSGSIYWTTSTTLSLLRNQ